MNSIEDGLFGARQAELDANMPGRVGLNAALDEQDRVKREASNAEADKKWREASPQPNFNHREAHAQGVDLVNGDRPNQFVEPGSVNIAGHDLATGTKVKSTVSRAYEGAAYYGASQLQRSWSLANKDKASRTTLSGEKPAHDIMPFTAVAASMQGSGSTYEDFARAFPAWSDDQLAASWNAGTDVLRQQEIVKTDGWGPMLGLYQPSPKHLDFDVRMADKEFQQVGRRLYQHFHGSKFPDTDIEAARWLADHMRNLDFSSPMMAAIMLKGKSAGPEVHKDYIRAIEAWHLTNMEWKLVPQLANAGRILFDPLNLAGANIGRLTLVSVGRLAALDFFKRMGVGAAGGATAGVVQVTVSESVQGRMATGEQQVAAAVVPAVVAGTASAILPEALALAGKGIKRGAQAFRRQDLPLLLPNNVRPEGVGDYIPANEVPADVLRAERIQRIRAEAAARPAGLPQTMEELQALPSERAGRAEDSATSLEQQPYEPREGVDYTEPPEGYGMGPAMDPDAAHAGVIANVDQLERNALALDDLTNTFLRETGLPPNLQEHILHDLNRGELDGVTRDMLTDTAAGRAVLDQFDRNRADARFEQQMDEADPAEVQAAADTAGARLRDMQAGYRNPDAAEQAAAALPPVQVARPALPRDPNSRVMVDPETGYYSPVQKTIAESPHGVQQPGQWLADIKRSPLLKQDELEWLELDKFFKGKDSVTKEELLAHIDEHMVKIQRHLLVPQRRNTVPWNVHVAKVNPKYELLMLEAEAIEEDLRTTLDPGPLNARLAELNAHMARVAGEERKVMMASGEMPPGVHDIEYMLTELGGDNAHHATEILDRIYKFLKDAQKAEQTLARARTDGGRKQAQARINGSQELIRINWGMLEEMADSMGAVVRPQDLDRIYGMINYGDPQVRDYSILGTGMRGTRFTAGGVDPIAHQIALFRHPEGLQAHGAPGHPGGDTPGTLGWAITSERNLANGETTTFIDEVQSDIAKERRRGEKQYREMKPAVDADPTLDFDGSDALRFSEDYDDYVYQVYRDSFNQLMPAQKRQFDRLPEHWSETTPAQRDAMMQRPLWGVSMPENEDVPALPKQIFYATAQASMLKSELYNAALVGKDNFSWATSEIIQKRYGAEPLMVQGNIEFELTGRNADKLRILATDTGPAGGYNRILSLVEADMLAEKLPDEARSMLEKYIFSIRNGPGMPLPGISFDLDEPLYIKPGAYWAYNVQIKKELEKFIAKYGGKVEQQEMPVAPGSGDTVKVWNIKLPPELRQKLLERGVPFGVAGAATGLAATQQEETQ